MPTLRLPSDSDVDNGSMTIVDMMGTSGTFHGDVLGLAVYKAVDIVDNPGIKAAFPFTDGYSKTAGDTIYCR